MIFTHTKFAGFILYRKRHFISFQRKFRRLDEIERHILSKHVVDFVKLTCSCRQQYFNSTIAFVIESSCRFFLRLNRNSRSNIHPVFIPRMNVLFHSSSLHAKIVIVYLSFHNFIFILHLVKVGLH